MTMGKMEIEEWKTMIIFLLHLGGKWDVYIESEELNTAKFDKPGVGIKKMVTKNWCQITDYENGVKKNQLWKWHYE